ncbi:MAG TPA: Ca2+-dependent phosphoinositide-specific phospholipase C [Myxococcota bacterium]|nr:Ca2+-dependent phosphoinositide-specific phospholipase C [Myxococcota bacterium]HQK50259.1 Ca2+-dependent phosphoinositide-specific phospholipase C [Myxococcota bacterium]
MERSWKGPGWGWVLVLAACGSPSAGPDVVGDTVGDVLAQEVDPGPGSQDVEDRDVQGDDGEDLRWPGDVPEAGDWGLDSEGGGEEPPPPGPLDDRLRLDHLQWEGTHNSYHVASPGAPPEWNYTHAPLKVQLERQGVRQVELDVHWDPDLQAFTVFHIPYMDPETTCATFRECLQAIRGWSDAHRGHAPIFVLVEPKDDMDDVPITGHLEDLDREVLGVFPASRLMLPDDVRGQGTSIREAIASRGWPTLRQTRGRVVFVLLDEGAHREAYLDLHPDLWGAVFFARGGAGEPWGAVMEHGNPLRDQEAVRRDVAAGYLVRSGPETREEVEAALELGVHLISTDRPDPIFGAPFAMGIPGGRPMGCNPVTAPEECTAAAVEDLGLGPVVPRAGPRRPADCLWDRRCDRVMVAAHRGDHRRHPENSLGGIRGAAAIGASLAEIDVRETRDGALVLMHDPTVDRTTDGSGPVSEMTLAEVRELRLTGPGGDGPEDRQVPTFEEALALARELDLVLYVDQKTSDTDRVTRAIAEAEAWDWALVRDDWPVAVAQGQREPRLRVMPAVDSVAAFEAVQEGLPDVRIVEVSAGGVEAALYQAIRGAGVKIQQDVMAGGDLFAAVGDYSAWGAFLRAGVQVPQTDWPAVLGPLGDLFNQSGGFPDEGPLLEEADPTR